MRKSRSRSKNRKRLSKMQSWVAGHEMRVVSREIRDAGLRSQNVNYQSYRSLSSPLARELNICPGFMAFLLKLLPWTGAFLYILKLEKIAPDCPTHPGPIVILINPHQVEFWCGLGLSQAISVSDDTSLTTYLHCSSVIAHFPSITFDYKNIGLNQANQARPICGIILDLRLDLARLRLLTEPALFLHSMPWLAWDFEKNMLLE